MFAPPSSQVATLSNMFGRIAARYQPYREAPTAHLHIVGGLHDGCTSKFKQDVVRIGASSDADFVLIDPEVSEGHAEIGFVHSLMGPLATVKALSKSVTVGDEVIEPGHSTQYLKLPVRLDFADGLSVEVSTNEHAWKKPASRPQRVLRGLRVFGVTLFLAAVGLVLMDASDGRDLLLIPQDSASLASDAAQRDPITREDLVAQLEQANLADKVRVSENADGLFQISGNLTAAQWRAWEQVSMWYDRNSVGRPLLSSLTMGTKFGNLPPISMLQVSDPKRIFLANGDILTVNDVFSGDWVISMIEPDFIEVQRGEERERIRFAGSEL